MAPDAPGPDDGTTLTPLTIAANLFASAEVLLVTSEGTLEERLYTAYSELALAATPFAPDLPDPVGMAISDLHASLTGSYEFGGPDQREVLRVSLAMKSKAELQRAAIAVCTITDYLQDALRDERQGHRATRSTCSHCGSTSICNHT